MADLLPILTMGELYYIAVRQPLEPKAVGSVVRFVEYLGRSPFGVEPCFWFKFIDQNFTGSLKPECIVRVGKTPMLDGPEAVA